MPPAQRSSGTLAVIVAFIIIEIGSLPVKSGQQCNTHSPYLLERVPMRAEELKHTLSRLPGRGVTGQPMLSPRSPSPASTLHAGREIVCQLSADTTQQDRRAWISTPSRDLRCFRLRPRCQNHRVTLRDYTFASTPVINTETISKNLICFSKASQQASPGKG